MSETPLDRALLRLAGPGDKVVPFDEFRRRRDEQEQQRTDQQRQQVGDVFDSAFETMSQDPGFQYPGLGEFNEVWERQGLLKALMWYRDHRGQLDPRTEQRVQGMLRDTLTNPSSGFNVEDDQIESFNTYTTESHFPGYQQQRSRGIRPDYWEKVLFGGNAEAIGELLIQLDPRSLSEAEWRWGYQAYQKWKQAIQDVGRVVLSPIRSV